MIFQSNDLVIDEIGERCLVYVHAKKAPSSDEYEHILQLYRDRRAELPNYTCLAITDGAGPTLAQRKQLQKEFGDILKNIPTAIVSDAITVRFVASSAALFIKTIKSFDIDEFDNALGFLGVDDEERGGIRGQLGQIPSGRFRTLDAVLGR